MKSTHALLLDNEKGDAEDSLASNATGSWSDRPWLFLRVTIERLPIGEISLAKILISGLRLERLYSSPGNLGLSKSMEWLAEGGKSHPQGVRTLVSRIDGRHVMRRA